MSQLRGSVDTSHSALGPLDSECLDSCIYSPIPNTCVGLSQILAQNRLWSCQVPPAPVSQGMALPGSRRGGFSTCHPVPAFPLPLLSRSPSHRGKLPGGWSSSSQHGSFPSTREGTTQGQDCWKQPTNTEHRCVQTPQSRAQSLSAMSYVRAAAQAPLRAPGAGGERALQDGEFPLAKKTFRLF